jgi:hypothetical protein
MAIPAIVVTVITKNGLCTGGRGCASSVRMNNINSFRDLLVWQKSMDLAVRCDDLIPTASAEILVADAQEVGRMINGLVRSLERTARS